MVDENTPTTDTIAEGGGEQSRPNLQEINERPGQTDDLEARRAAATRSDRYSADDLRYEDGELRARDQALKREAAAGTPYEPSDLSVEDGEVTAPEPTERVDVRVFDPGEGDPAGDVTLVGPDGERRDLGADAGGGEPFFARVDAPDREGTYRVEVGGETVKRFTIGPAGAAVDDPGNLSYGWNGTIIDADRDGAGVTQEDYDPDKRSASASADPDVVAGAGAAEALQAGVDTETLSPANPISEAEGERIAEAVEQAEAQQQQQQADRLGAGMTDQQLAMRGSDANRQLRERIASERDGLSPDQVDVVATDDGLAYQTDGAQIGTEELDFGASEAQSPGPTAPSPDEAFDSDGDGAVEGERRVVDGPQAQPSGTTRISDPTDVEGQSERALSNRGDVRASVNRFGQRQLDQQAISTGTRDPTPGTTPGVLDRVLTADADPEIAQDLTDSGGFLAEDGDRGTPVTNATGISEADLREPSDPVLPDVLPSRRQLRRGGAGETALFRSNAEDPSGTVPDREGVGERALEGAAVAGASILNVRERAADAEQIVEGVQALPREVREEGAGDVGETLTALGRREGVQTVRRFESDPVRASSGLALDVAGGAVAAGRVPDTRDLKAEVDPRIGMFGETIESRALGLRSDGADSDAGVDVDRSQTVGDQVSGLPTERPGGLSAEVVDEARGVSGPSRTSRVRGQLERGIDRVRERFQAERERVSVDTRVGAGVGGIEVRRETDTAPDSPSDFSPSRDEVLAGSPRDRIGNDIADRQQAARQQFAGDFEGAPSPFGRDGATFDPTADADSRRRAAERRFAEQDTGTDLDGDGRRAFAPDVRGGVAGGLLAGAFGRAEQAQQSTVTNDVSDFDTGRVDRVDVTTGVDTVGDVRGGGGLDQRAGTRLDQNTRIDTSQDIRQSLDTRQDIDTRRDLDTGRDFGSDFDPDYDPDRNPDFDTDTDVYPRPEPRPEPDDAAGFGVGFGFDDEEFENQIATPSQFFF